MVGEFSDITKEVKEGGEQASKVKKEIEMMIAAARDSLWTEVNQAEVGSTSLNEANEYMNQDDRDAIIDQIKQTRELFNAAKEQLGDDKGELTGADGGMLKGIDKDLVELLETKLADLETALQ